VIVEDLGRVVIRIGDRSASGSSVRRKVLALLCYLTSRPRFSSTREEVMEAMWPDQPPTAAINSLNQSVYFLRRVFEPAFSEDTTAGYVRQDSELLWLDPDLIEARSERCAKLIGLFEKAPSPDTVRQLSLEYAGRFALDFAYDDWSADYREWLHVAYLRAVEAQLEVDLRTGSYNDGIAVARRALAIESRHEGLAWSLHRLLRAAGAHSAAAEQYSHYANMVRVDLGVEPRDPEGVSG
jgi:DNA-binding SARP family transcriptional activator